MTDPPESPEPFRGPPPPPAPPAPPGLAGEFDPELDFEPYDDPTPDLPERPELWDRVGDVHPGFTYGLVLLVLVAFALELTGAYSHRGDLWTTGTLDAPSIVRGAVLWPRIVAGEWWRVLAPLFLHANLLHVGSNLVAFAVVGGVVERVYGHGRLLVLFALCGVAAAGASAAHQAAQIAAAVHAGATANLGGSIGASGAVYGLGAAVVAAAVRLRGLIPPWRARALVGATLPLLLSSLAAGFAHPEIDSAAHLGGALAGLLLGFALPFSPRLTLVPEPAWVRAGWAAGGLFAAILLIVSAAIAFGLPRPL